MSVRRSRPLRAAQDLLFFSQRFVLMSFLVIAHSQDFHGQRLALPTCDQLDKLTIIFHLQQFNL